MASHSQNSRGSVEFLWSAAIAVLCGTGTLAAAQDQPAPKWELFADTPSSIPAPMCTACFPEDCFR